MLRREQRRRARVSEEEQSLWDNEMDRIDSSNSMVREFTRSEGPRPVSLKDTSGREIPVSERAPLPIGTGRGSRTWL